MHLQPVIEPRKPVTDNYDLDVPFDSLAVQPFADGRSPSSGLGLRTVKAQNAYPSTRENPKGDESPHSPYHHRPQDQIETCHSFEPLPSGVASWAGFGQYSFATTTSSAGLKDGVIDEASMKFTSPYHGTMPTIQSMIQQHHKVLLDSPSSPKSTSTKAGLAQSLFDRVDVNHDGVITREEFNRAQQSLFDRMDVNHDGVISRAEFNRAHQAGPNVQAGLSQSLFERVDVNHDGVITREEFNRAQQSLFDKLDVNHNGVISREEFIRAYEAGQIIQSMPASTSHLHETSETDAGVAGMCRATNLRFSAISGMKTDHDYGARQSVPPSASMPLPVSETSRALTSDRADPLSKLRDPLVPLRPQAPLQPQPPVPVDKVDRLMEGLGEDPHKEWTASDAERWRRAFKEEAQDCVKAVRSAAQEADDPHSKRVRRLASRTC